MNYHNITKDDMLNGEGLRVVLWVAGCSHNCPECQNPQTHDPNSGLFFDRNAYLEIIEELNKPYVKGITFSGGDPLYVGNREVITDLCKQIKQDFPRKNIWMYTGFRYEDVQDLEVMNYIDVLIDGRFVPALKDVQLHWKGSSNQRVIDIKKTRLTGEVCLTD